MSAEPSVQCGFPSRIADLGFSVELPDSWQPQALPDEMPDFDDGTRLFGLGAAVARRPRRRHPARVDRCGQLDDAAGPEVLPRDRGWARR